ncbi:MFS general substrate transporter [Lentithecium fluviatile CBS 122367]|uniref:MFS general substrate transporter n=1 Tax=Lentithecium fluviatile CBS 122367 TaxID=1168545 RepID=A0A6G1JDU0_9PLEO|nr:MFS general substrate transporter [Lentithecium fluviatile CBS 122367]
MEKDWAGGHDPLSAAPRSAENKELRDVAGGNVSYGSEEEASAGGLGADNVVDWEGEEDTEKPLNWSTARKLKNFVVICYTTFLTPLGSTMFAPAIPQVMAAFQSSNLLLASFVVSVWILEFFFGPRFLGPLSELYGRLLVYIVCNFLFTVFNIATAVAPSLSALVVFRFLAGTFGGCPITIGAGTFGDLIKPEHRVKCISPVQYLGPILGPIAGGYLAEDLGCRWICWVLSIAAGVGSIASVLFQEETYPVILLERKAAQLRKSTQNENLRSALAGVDRSPRRVFARSIVQPLKLLFLSSIVAILSAIQGIIYGLMYPLFTTFPLVFQSQYGFGTGTVGLTYIGMGVGSLIGLGVADAEGRWKPEYRLLPLIPGCFFVPVGLLWYGWAAQDKIHWIVPIIGTAFIGMGVNTLMMCIATYFIDAHPLYEASATAALTAVRSPIGCLVPLFGRSMYEALNLGWGNSLPGFLSLAMCPLPWVFFKYGERIRTSPKHQLKL